MATYRWETPEKRLLRLPKIPPKKKLELLQQMHKLVAKCPSARKAALRRAGGAKLDPFTA